MPARLGLETSAVLVVGTAARAALPVRRSKELRVPREAQATSLLMPFISPTVSSHSPNLLLE